MPLLSQPLQIQNTGVLSGLQLGDGTTSRQEGKHHKMINGLRGHRGSQSRAPCSWCSDLGVSTVFFNLHKHSLEPCSQRAPMIDHVCSGLRAFVLFPVQEELGRTISQLIHAFQTPEAREYPRHGRAQPLDTRPVSESGSEGPVPAGVCRRSRGRCCSVCPARVCSLAQRRLSSGV